MTTKLFNIVRDNSGEAVPVTRLGAAPESSDTVSTSATTGVALAYGMYRVTATENVYLQFGGSGVTATADPDESLLFLAGTEILIIPEGTTYWSGIRAGASDSVVQFYPVNDL